MIKTAFVTMMLCAALLWVSAQGVDAQQSSQGSATEKSSPSATQDQHPGKMAPQAGRTGQTPDQPGRTGLDQQTNRTGQTDKTGGPAQGTAAQPAQPATRPQPGAQGAGAAGATEKPGTMAQVDDRTFLQRASSGGKLQVQLGQLAQQRSQNTEVKDLGRMLSEQHSQMNEQLQQLVQRKNLSFSAKLSTENQRVLDRLSNVPANQFDRAFVDYVIRDHQKDIAQFEYVANNGRDNDIKTLAGDGLPKLRDHLRMAQSIADTMPKQGQSSQGYQGQSRTGEPSVTGAARTQGRERQGVTEGTQGRERQGVTEGTQGRERQGVTEGTQGRERQGVTEGTPSSESQSPETQNGAPEQMGSTTEGQPQGERQAQGDQQATGAGSHGRQGRIDRTPGGQRF